MARSQPPPLQSAAIAASSSPSRTSPRRSDGLHAAPGLNKSSSSPNLPTSDDDPSSTSFHLGDVQSTPSPRAARGSVVGDRDAVPCLDVVTRFERCFSYLAEVHDEVPKLRRRENNELLCRGNHVLRQENNELRREKDAFRREKDELRREKYELRRERDDLACSIRKLGGELSDEFRGLRRAMEHPTGHDYRLHGKHPTELGSQSMFVGVDGSVKARGGGGELGQESRANSGSAAAIGMHSQGMVKTELCIMWERDRSCPFGDECNFAHGMGELRPVIRHPRYRTEVCRMVRAGEVCSFGNRCHFLHSITPTDLA